MNETETLVTVLNEELSMALPQAINMDEIKERLSGFVRQCMESDFQKLILLLYRVDVDENKLRRLLEESTGVDTDKLIAGLILERQLEKIRSKETYKMPDENIDEKEKW